jgi:nucleoside-diphosphate-sugar epimerase
MDAVNHLGTHHLAEAAAAAGVRRFVYISSVGSYGALPTTGHIDEAFPHMPRNAYEASKDAGEAAVRAVGARTGMSVVVLQPSNVIGLTVDRSAYPLLGLMRMISKRLLVWFGSVEPYVNYVSVDDAAAAALASLDAPAGTYIINTPARLADVVAWISDELDCPFPRRHLPLWVGQLAASMGSALERGTGCNMPLQRERLTELTNTNRYDPTLFMRATGFVYPMGVENLVRFLVRTYREWGLL